MNKASKKVIKMRKDWAKGDAQRDKGNKEPESVTKVKDILYKVCDDGCELKLDVYYPYKAKELLPVIFSIHGGGYFYGDKELYRFLCMSLADRGVCVVNINYRLAPEYNFPDAILDINDAINWVGENINKYYGDAGRVMLIGDSAGAQLASQMGAIYSNPKYAKMFNIVKTKKVNIKALSLACGFYDLGSRVKESGVEDFLSDYIGPNGDFNDPRLQVLNYVNEKYPPTYAFTGVGDFLIDHAEPFAEFLKDKGVLAESKIYKPEQGDYLGHVFHCNLKLNEATKCNDDQVAFFMKILNS